MKKREEATGQTKQNLMEAFWACYCEQKIEKITVKAIASKAGYNRSTFYEYFTDAYDVLEQIEASLIPSIDQLPPVALDSGAFGMPLDHFMTLYEQNSKYYAVLLGDKGDPAFANKLKNSVKPMLMKVFENQTELEQVRLDYVLEYTLTAMIGMMGYWYNHPKPLSNEQLYALMHQLMRDGVLKQFELSQKNL